MLISYKRSQSSVVLRVKLRDSSVSTGAGLTGLTSASSGLIISTIADNEATATAYTVAAGNVETISTLGTYSAPTASKCRFKEVDATNHPGVYEIQIADARFAVAGAKSLLVSISGATNLAQCDTLVPLVDLDPYDSVRAGLTALPNAAADAAGGLPISDAGGLDLDTLDSNVSAILADTNELQTDWADGGRLDVIVDAILVDTGTTIPGVLGTPAGADLATDIAAIVTDLADGTVVVGTINDGAIGAAAVADIFSTTTIAEAYAADGAAGTPAQILYLMQQMLTEFAISSTTLTAKKLDGSTSAATFTLDDATSPTSITRAS